MSISIKYYATSICLLCAGAILQAATLKTEIISGPVQVGMHSQLALIHNGTDVPEFSDVPQINGLRWISAGARQSINEVNGQVSRTMMSIYTFTVDKPGSYTIPATDVKAGKTNFKSKEITFTAVQPKLAGKSGNASQDDADIDKLLFSKMSITPKLKDFYAGEEIPIEIELYMASNVNARPSWPEITTGDKATVIFKDYKAQNPENPKFAPPSKTEVTLDGRAYNVFILRTVLRPISIGKLELKAATKLLVTVRNTQQRRQSSVFDDDDFFGSFFSNSRRIEHTVRSSLPPITIKPLPPYTGDAKFLGLVGKWRIDSSLSRDNVKVGEAVTLTLKIQGEGTTETLNAPALEIPGLRVYSPETEKASSSATIKYVLIPTQIGAKKIECKFTTFDPAEQKYKEVSFLKNLNVEKADSVFKTPNGPGVIDAAEDEIQETKAQNKRGPAGVLYLKKPPFKEIQAPLWKNSIFTGLFTLLIGLLFWIGMELRYARNRFRSNDPGFIRRDQAKKAKSSLLNRLNTCPPEKISGMDGEIASYVNDALNLPPGAALAESAHVLKEENKELSNALKTLSDSSWSRTAVSEDFKKQLIKLLSRLVCAAFIFGAIPLSAAAPKPIESPEAAMTAYDEGRFAEAEAYYRAQTKKSALSAKLLYNIGNCLFQEGKYARALANYEKALRLAPRDSDILENLNLTRRKLSLQEKNILEKPSDLIPFLRDMLRPDEWLFMACFGAALLFCGLGLRRLTSSRSLWMSIAGVGAAVILIASTAMLIQNMSSYDRSTAIVLSRNAPIHALPSEQASKLTDVNLLPGEAVHIEETRLDWVRIRAGAAEGWVKKSDVERLWDL